jgi:GATA-binding protein
VKANQQGRKRVCQTPIHAYHSSSNPLQNNETANQSLPAQHPDSAAILAAEAARRVSAAHDLTNSLHHERSASPLSQSGHNHSSNIAPQAMFDSVTLDHNSFYASPSLSQNPFRPISPSGLSQSGAYQGDVLVETKALQTRVSELEVINGLFKGSVQELEMRVEEHKRAEEIAKEETRLVRNDMEAQIADLRRQLIATQAELAEVGEGRSAKRIRMSDIVKDDSDQETSTSGAEV